MKKISTPIIFTFITLSICLFAQTGYDGPKDKTYWSQDDILHGMSLNKTTLGPLARYSDVIGVGQVSQRTNNHFTVFVNHAILGCTNGANLKIYAYNKHGELYDAWRLSYFLPTNQSQIVFAAYTNVYHGGYAQMFWGQTEVPKEELYFIRKELSIKHLNRSWWYADRDDGLLLAQFTNILQTVRFNNNWTNFFYLCRDGANSPSNRVREDSFKDLGFLTFLSTPEQFQFILADPLVDQKHKDWRLSKPELNP